MLSEIILNQNLKPHPMKAKVFQFKPADFGTDYLTIKGIYKFGSVTSLGEYVYVEYIFDWQLMSLFVQIPITTYVAPPSNAVNPHRWDKPLALLLIIIALIFAWTFFTN
jgi:hypothetical protein